MLKSPSWFTISSVITHKRGHPGAKFEAPECQTGLRVLDPRLRFVDSGLGFDESMLGVARSALAVLVENFGSRPLSPEVAEHPGRDAKG